VIASFEIAWYGISRRWSLAVLIVAALVATLILIRSMVKSLSISQDQISTEEAVGEESQSEREESGEVLASVNSPMSSTVSQRSGGESLPDVRLD
jgi:hypothetical protein